MHKTTTKKTTGPALPEPITKADLDYPQSNRPAYGTKAYEKWIAINRVVEQFELWYTDRFGWCIPTLQIRHAGSAVRSRNASITQDRTYAVRVSDGGVVRIGFGPHVTAQVRVYVSEGRRKALQSFLDLRTKGQADAGDIRDRISTRRAQTAMRHSSWGGIF